MPDPRKMKAAAKRAADRRQKAKKEDRNRAPRQEYLAGESLGLLGGAAKQKVSGSGVRTTYVGPTNTVIRDQRGLMGNTYETRFETERPPRTVKVKGKSK